MPPFINTELTNSDGADVCVLLAIPSSPSYFYAIKSSKFVFQLGCDNVVKIVVIPVTYAFHVTITNDWRNLVCP